MIDKNKIDRHIIVKKNKEVTQIERVQYTNITEEEVIFNALGFSLYEILKPKNIIFEGWRDKKLFEIFLDSKYGLKVLSKKERNNIGLLHAIGVKDINRIVEICENHNRDYVIITDADNPALEKKKEFHRKEKWITYKDIDNCIEITTEDFIAKNIINKCLQKALKNFNYAGDLTIPEETNSNFIKLIEGKIKDIFVSHIDNKKLLNEIKDLIFESSSPDNLNENYTKVAREIIRKLKNGI